MFRNFTRQQASEIARLPPVRVCGGERGEREADDGGGEGEGRIRACMCWPADGDALASSRHPSPDPDAPHRPRWRRARRATPLRPARGLGTSTPVRRRCWLVPGPTCFPCCHRHVASGGGSAARSPAARRRVQMLLRGCACARVQGGRRRVVRGTRVRAPARLPAPALHRCTCPAVGLGPTPAICRPWTWVRSRAS